MKRGVDDSYASGTSHHQHQASKRTKIQIEEPQFPKLDQSDPVQSRRIQQRRRMIQIGKNTVGYAEYVKKVPKHKRHPRSMKQPSTPDHTLNIGAKRWQGLVKAWRKALHQYDPPDLAKAFEATKTDSKKQECGEPTEEAHSSVQDRQLAEANTMLVDASKETQAPAEVSPTTVASNDDEAGGFDHHDDDEKTLEELARWEDSQQTKSSDDFLLDDDDDSDDDLL